MKKKIVVALTLLFVWLSVTAVSALSTEVTDPNDISVYVDDEYLVFATKPFNEKGTIMIPFRVIFEKLGLEVSWEAETQTVRGSKDGLSIELQVGNQKAFVNGEMKVLPVAPKIVNNSVFVPLRFVGESAQREVAWHDHWKQVIIADTKEQIRQNLIMHSVFISLEDKKGLLTLYKKDSDAFHKAVNDTIPKMSQYDRTHDLVGIEKLEQFDDYVSVIANIEYANNLTDQSTISKTEFLFSRENGLWKIENYIERWIQHRSPEYPESTITLSPEDKSAIQALIQTKIDLVNDKDIVGLDEIFVEDSFGAKAWFIEIMTKYNIEMTLKDFQFISNAKNTAIIKTTSIYEHTDNAYLDFYLEVYITLSKNDTGAWKITSMDTKIEGFTENDDKEWFLIEILK